MNSVLHKNDPKTSDVIRLEIKTFDSYGCLITPYKINNLKVSFIERIPGGINISSYQDHYYDPTLEKEFNDYKDIVCEALEENTPEAISDKIAELERIKNKLEDSKSTQEWYYNSVSNVINLGLENPAWLDLNQVPSLEQSSVANNNVLSQSDVGVFYFDWNSDFRKEGDYFLTWEWQPLIAGDTLFGHEKFTVFPDNKLTVSNPKKTVPDDKYDMLMERYLPKHILEKFSSNDLSAEVITEYNKAVGKLFLFLDNQANQLLGMIDPNSTNEEYLPLLANLFNIKLKSQDPVRWKAQIKTAIPLFKKKGTLSCLKSNLDYAGMRLVKFTNLWQIKSKYSCQEKFTYLTNEFKLKYEPILPLNQDVFKLFIELEDGSWNELTSDYINVNSDGTFEWIGDSLNEDPIQLKLNDNIRIIYQHTEYPNYEEETIDLYTLSLPISDTRSSIDQEFPPIDWNTRVIEENDAMFDIIINEKHPFFDYFPFGKIRTKFPYSENAYNMEEYNGSLRDSFNACDIDKYFTEPCYHCLSSKYNIEVEIEELSDDKIIEFTKILEENVPFHLLPHTIRLHSSFQDFINVQDKSLDYIFKYNIKDTLLISSQYKFMRSIPFQEANDNFKRNIISNMELELGPINVSIKNNEIILVCPGTSTTDDIFNNKGNYKNLQELGINLSTTNSTIQNNSNILEIKSPSVLAGSYTLDNVINSTATIINPTFAEPVDESQFVFKISNKIISSSTSNITQIKTFNLSDKNFNHEKYSVVTQWDIDKGHSSDSVWEVRIGINSFEIINVNQNGQILIKDTGVLSNSNQTNVSWVLLDSNNEEVFQGLQGEIKVDFFGEIELDSNNFFNITDVKNILKLNDELKYNSNNYKIIKFLDAEKVLVSNYNSGDALGVAVDVYRCLADNLIGKLEYKGQKIHSPLNLESILNIQNGANPPVQPIRNSNKENYLILLGSQSPDLNDETYDYYYIKDIDNNDVEVGGPNKIWTLSNQNVICRIYKFTKEDVEVFEREKPPIEGHIFDDIEGLPKGVDRSSSNVIKIDSINTVSMLSDVLNKNDKVEGQNDYLELNESISFKIEYDDGKIQEGEI